MKQSTSSPRGGANGDAGREPRGMAATIQELQNELAAERQRADAAGALQWEFLRHIGHEIRNPMTAIIGMTDLALMTELDDEQRECLTTVDRAAKGLMRVLNNVQDYARLQAGTLELEFIGFRLRDCLKQSLGKFASQAQAKGLELLCRVHEEAPDALVGDVRRLAQVVEHLLANAVVNTPRGEVAVEVNVAQEDDKEVTLRFRVRDTGIGMPLEDCKRISTAWTRPRSTDPRTRSGAGLGLPMVFGLAKLFGGSFTVHSSSGQGTLCEFTAAFLKQQSVSQPSQTRETAVELRGRRVLIVAASDTGRRWLTESCERWGLSVMVSEPSLAAAQSCLAQAASPPDLALIDTTLLAPEHPSGSASTGLDALPVPKVLLSWPRSAAEDVIHGSRVLATVTKPVFEDELQAGLSTAFAAIEEQTRASGAGRRSSATKESNMHCEPQEAMARLGGDRELYGDIVRRFSDDAGAVLDKLRTHVQDGNADMLHRTAHSFKGLAAMCGALSVTETAAQLEAAGKEERLSDAPALLEQLAQNVDDARRELAEYIL